MRADWNDTEVVLTTPTGLDEAIFAGLIGKAASIAAPPVVQVGYETLMPKQEHGSNTFRVHARYPTGKIMETMAKLVAVLVEHDGHSLTVRRKQ